MTRLVPNWCSAVSQHGEKVQQGNFPLLHKAYDLSNGEYKEQSYYSQTFAPTWVESNEENFSLVNMEPIPL